VYEMDISNVNTTHSAAAVVKATGAAVPRTPATQGNSLPLVGQDKVRLEKPESQPTAAELRDLLGQANAALQARFSDLKFTVDEGTDINVVRVEDSETGEVIRQFPSEAMLAIARALADVEQGMMLEEKA
jgi:flagellar protein FlaG